MNLRRRGLAASTALAAVLLASCGSSVDPATFAAVNGGGAGGGGVGTVDGVTTGDDGLVGGAPGEPGAVAGSSGDDGSAATDAGTGGGSGSADGGTSGGEAPSGSGGNAPTGGAKAASCDGFKNQTGVTDKEIVLANASDLTGPIPGLFQSAQDGTAAYIAYFNATSDICGRKLKMLGLDSKSSGAGDQSAYATACEQAFASVGSVSVFDSGGAKVATDCGLPDLRAVALTDDRSNSPVSFPSQSVEVGVVSTANFDMIKKIKPQAIKRAAFVYLNIGGSPALAKSYSETAAKVGFGVEMLTGIDTAEFNYGPYVQQMKEKDITFVYFVGGTQQAVRLADTMAQQQFKPDVFYMSQTQYTSDFVKQGGSVVDGVTIPIAHVPFDQASRNKELALYLSWLKQVKPSAQPTSFGLFAWSAARLFVETSIELGGRLDRASLIQGVKTERQWTANGLHTPMDVGGKGTYKCSRLVQLNGGTWKQLSPGEYNCGTLVRTSVAG